MRDNEPPPRPRPSRPRHPFVRRAIAALLVTAVPACGWQPSTSTQTQAVVPIQPTTLDWPAAMVVPSGSAVGTLEGYGGVSASGQYQYTLPIDVPPGRLGMAPALALVYTSSDDDGLLGVGWSLSGISAVKPCMKTHATHQVANKGGLCWDGRPLVKVPGSAVEYRTEAESFAKIVDDGDAGVTIWTKDGHTLKFQRGFGGTYLASALLVEDADRRGNAVRYTYDVVSAGESYPNTITYTHQGQRNHDAKRTIRFAYKDRPDPITTYRDGIRYDVTRRLISISASAPNPVTIEDVWRYDLTYKSSPGSKRSLLSQVDRTSWLGGRSLAKQFDWESTAGPNYLAGIPIDLGREWITKGDAVIADFNQDGKDDILRGDTLLYTGASGVALQQAYHHVFAIAAGIGVQPDLQRSKVADLDGDGFPELIAELGNDYYAFAWNQAQHDFSVLQDLGPSRGNRLDDNALFLPDLDGDGLADMVKGVTTSDGDADTSHWPRFPASFLWDWSVQLNQGHGQWSAEDVFAHSEANHQTYNEYVPLAGLRYPAFGVNAGTGRAVSYAIAQYGTGYHPVGIQGVALDDAGHGVLVALPDEVGGGKFGSLYELQAFADINGDTLEDYVYLTADGGTVSLCVAANNKGDGQWEPSAPGAGCASAPGAGSETNWRLVSWDVDGDRRDDVVAVHLASTGVADGPGYRFFEDATGAFQLVEFQASGVTPYVVGDFDGDGTTDVVTFDGNGDAAVQLQATATDEPATTADVVIGVRDENASQPIETITYSTTWGPELSATWSDIHGVSDAWSTAYPVRAIKSGFRVVREHDVYQGDDVGAYLRSQYVYSDPTYDARGRGFRGFRVVEQYQPDVHADTLTFFDNQTNDYDSATRTGGVYPGAARPVERFQITPIGEIDRYNFTSDRARVRHWQGHYTRKPGTIAASYLIHQDSWTSEEWEQEGLMNTSFGQMPQMYDRNEATGRPRAGNAISEVRRKTGASTIDGSGNVLTMDEATEGGVWTHTATTYYPPDLATWRFGLPRSTSVASGESGHSASPRRTDFVYDAGLLQQALVEPTNPNPFIPATYTYARNSDGSVTSVTSSAYGVPDRTYSLTYDSSERMFVAAATNPMGHTSQMLTHPALGQVVATLDANGVYTHVQLDDRGNLRAVHPGAGAPWYNTYAPRLTNGFSNGVVVSTTSTDQSKATTAYDAQGRVVEVGHAGFGGAMIYSNRTYDLVGHMTGWSLPGFGAPASSGGRVAWDSLGRVIRSTPPGGFDTVYDHTFLTTTTRLPGGIERSIRRDLDGRVAASIQISPTGLPLETSFAYGAFGELETITDPQGNLTAFSYDQRGRRTLTATPDAGPDATYYNGLGDIWTTNVAGSATTFVRDLLGRPLEAHNADGVTTFTWDTQPHGLGKFASSVSPDQVTHTSTYDPFGRPQTETWTVGGVPYSFSNDYDAMGRLRARTYPTAGSAGVTIDNHYDPYGYLAQVDRLVPGASVPSVYWTTTAMAANDQLASGVFGNGVVATRTYDPAKGRLLTIEDAGVMRYTYGYDLNGRVKNRDDGAGRVESFTYDSLERLDTAAVKLGSATRSTEYTYDDIGNLLSEKSTPGGLVVHTAGAGNNGPHTLDGASKYDARGRLENPNGTWVTYNEFDLPSRVDETTFGYDAEHQRVLKTGPSGTVLTLGGLFEQRTEGGQVTNVYYVPGLEGTVAQISTVGSTEEVAYIHSAGKGTVDAVSRSNGQLKDALYYDPFGQRTAKDGTVGAAASAGVNIGYDGLSHDDDLGFIDQRGRMYNPSTRRFLTPDPLVSNALNAQSYNPYSYVSNDPVNRIDPDGFEDIGTWFSNLFGGGAGPSVDFTPGGPSAGHGDGPPPDFIGPPLPPEAANEAATPIPTPTLTEPARSTGALPATPSESHSMLAYRSTDAEDPEGKYHYTWDQAKLDMAQNFYIWVMTGGFESVFAPMSNYTGLGSRPGTPPAAEPEPVVVAAKIEEAPPTLRSPRWAGPMPSSPPAVTIGEARPATAADFAKSGTTFDPHDPNHWFTGLADNPVKDGMARKQMAENIKLFSRYEGTCPTCGSKPLPVFTPKPEHGDMTDFGDFLNSK